MKCVLPILLVLMMTSFVPPGDKNEDFFLGGIMINEPDHERWVEGMQQSGMNTVEVTVYARQGIWNSDNIWWNRQEPAVESEICAAKEKGMKVVLVLRVLLDHYFDENKFLWHGMVAPCDRPTTEKWFEHYGMFVEMWAQKSEELGVDVFAIGSELRSLAATKRSRELPSLEEYYLNKFKQIDFIGKHLKYADQIEASNLWVAGYGNYQSLKSYLNDKVRVFESWALNVTGKDPSERVEKVNELRLLRESLWRKMIAKTRTVYTGKLTYAANFDNYQEIGFWDDLDFMGINAYFQLTGMEGGKVNLPSEMRNAWEDIFDDIKSFRKENNLSQQVIFTELGYTRKDRCTTAPWEGFGYSVLEELTNTELVIWDKQPYDLNERAMAVSTLHEVHQQDRSQLLAGILYWKLTTQPELLTYEPFGLWVSDLNQDPMLGELLKFSSP
jgi:hypothetical protein